MDADNIKLGLLVETAQTHQQLVEALLDKLRQQTSGLDTVLRQEIRRALVDELGGVHVEAQRTVDALKRTQRAVNARTGFWSLGIAALCVTITLAVAWWWLPSAAEIARLRQERGELAAAVERLEKLGGKVQLLECANGRRLCVRIDPKAGRYGAQSDYYVIKGY